MANKLMTLIVLGITCMTTGCSSVVEAGVDKFVDTAVSTISLETNANLETITNIETIPGMHGPNPDMENGVNRAIEVREFLSQNGNGTDTSLKAMIQTLEEKVEKASSKNYASETDTADTVVTFKDGKVEMLGEGVDLQDNTLVINQSGSYMFTGVFEGQIKVNTPEEDVQLMFNNLNISSAQHSPIIIEQADEVTVTLMSGSQNYIYDSSLYLEEANKTLDEVKANGALFSNDDIYINGLGSLSIESEFKTAIFGKNDVLISDASLYIKSPRNGIKGNDLVYIGSGNLDITAGTDGIESNDLICIDGGKLTINESYEGLEALDILINGGEIVVRSDDDGINISGDAENLMGHGLIINNGDINIDSEGDGLDSNGSILMTGGNVLVNGPLASNNGSLDYNIEFEISGGNLLALGSVGMMQNPSTSSSVNTLSVGLSRSYPVGTKIALVDDNDVTIMEMTAQKEFQSFIYSNSELQLNETYKLLIDDVGVEEVLLTETVTSVGETGRMRNKPGRGFGKPKN